LKSFKAVFRIWIQLTTMTSGITRGLYEICLVLSGSATFLPDHSKMFFVCSNLLKSFKAVFRIWIQLTTITSGITGGGMKSAHCSPDQQFFFQTKAKCFLFLLSLVEIL
jgi:hypothetical protein